MAKYFWSNDLGCWMGECPPSHGINDYPKTDNLIEVGYTEGTITSPDYVEYEVKNG